MSEIYSNLLTQLIAPAIMLWLGWLIGKRKSNAEATSKELENVEKSLVIYRGIISDLEAKIERLELRIVELQNHLTNRCTCQKPKM